MKRLLLLLCFVTTQIYSQEEVGFFDDFQAIKNSSTIFYNVYGTTITTETYNYNFNEKGLKKVFRKYKFNFKKTKKVVDSKLETKHFIVNDSTSTKSNYVSYSNVYFVDNNSSISIIFFNGTNKLRSSFKRQFVQSFLDKKIPESIYIPSKIDSIKFVKRYIKLGPSCRWMGVRNIQCPYNGQMDWTIHKSLEAAKEFNKFRESISTEQRKLKPISREVIDIQFEGKVTKATKVIYDVKGLNSFLLNISSGAKNLIVYYIAENIRGKNVSCILSHWDNDRIQENGLPALLGEVMNFKD